MNKYDWICLTLALILVTTGISTKHTARLISQAHVDIVDKAIADRKAELPDGAKDDATRLTLSVLRKHIILAPAKSATISDGDGMMFLGAVLITGRLLFRRWAKSTISSSET